VIKEICSWLPPGLDGKFIAKNIQQFPGSSVKRWCHRQLLVVT